MHKDYYTFSLKKFAKDENQIFLKLMCSSNTANL